MTTASRISPTACASYRAVTASAASSRGVPSGQPAPESGQPARAPIGMPTYQRRRAARPVARGGWQILRNENRPVSVFPPSMIGTAPSSGPRGGGPAWNPAVSDGLLWRRITGVNGGAGERGRLAAPREDTMKLAPLLSSAVALAASVATVTA